jgi:hypothetical protein
MSDKQVFKLTDSSKTRAVIIEAILNAPVGHVVTVAPETRSLAQNRYQWPILSAFAKQVMWPINGALQYILPDDWKDILTAAFRRETVRIAQGWDGHGVVMLGQRTSKFNKKEFADWIEFLNMAAAEKGVDIEHD